MAYEPKEWVCGETITAEGLNNLEEGVQEALDCCGGAEPFVVRIAYNNDSGMMETDKTWQEIFDAFSDGKDVSFMMISQNRFMNYAFWEIRNYGSNYNLSLCLPEATGSTIIWSFCNGTAQNANSVVTWEE